MNHLQEWSASCVDDQLTRLNVISLEGAQPYDYLFYSEAIPRRNDGRVSTQFLKRYEHTEEGGWWCSGIDLLTGHEDNWGCFKPEKPRYTADRQKVIKYEHPPKAPTGVFALRVPLHLWERIAHRYQQKLSPQEIETGFWQWLQNHPEIPLCVTEGAKKAGALLTAGYAAIALPGINGGYRVPRDDRGRRVGKSSLIPQLLALATAGREFYLVFDQDSKPRTIKAVDAAIRRTGYLLTQQGCPVKVVVWEQEFGKGIDDLIAIRGEDFFEQIYQQAASFDYWKARSLNRLTYQPYFKVNQRYLLPLDIPENAKLVALKSAKGTGKTKFLEGVVKEALEKGQWVLVLGHRVRLVEALCQRFGLNYVTEIKDSQQDSLLGYGLCVDSLHPNSQAQFNAHDWVDGVVIIDEVEQVLWHALNSSTCSSNRVAILKSLKTLMQNVLGGGGQVFVTDADLSDLALDYLIALGGVEIEPVVITNTWQPGIEEAWQVYHYPESKPKRLLKDLEKHIAEGGKPFVFLSAQKLKSQWGTSNLESYLQKQFPHKKILRLDSESLLEPSHPASNCITKLNQVLPHYDIVLASPVIETGISIELQGHFTSVWAIAQGIQAENSVRQSLGRIRENIPRYLWVAPYGFNQVGNGSTSIPTLLSSGQRLTQLNVRLLQQTDFASLDDLDTGFQAESLICWAKMAVRFNAGMVQYRETILTALQTEGHHLQEAPPSVVNKTKNTTNSLTEAITEVRDRNYEAECQGIAFAKDISDSTYNTLKKQLIKTPSQRRSQRKHELKLRYGIPVTTPLVIRDDQGWYQKIRLHYFLTVGKEHLAERDRLAAQRLINSGEGSIFLPDFNRSQLGATIGTMEILGIPVLLGPRGKELKNTDADLQKMAQLALSNRSEIKTLVGLGLAKNSSPIMIIRRFLDKIGYSLQYLRCESQGKKRIRVYQIKEPLDSRFEVFKYWFAGEGCYKNHHLAADLFPCLNSSDYPQGSNHVQLSL
ncbi:MAG: plasmid replication protein, CyRepA1 family, partial [Spirulinaceae cyanobacterium]